MWLVYDEGIIKNARKQPVYIFRGSPGKSTLVPLFCSMLARPVALIEHDTLRWNFHKIGREYAEVSEEEHMFAFNNLLVLTEQYLKSDRYAVVIEGLFTWDDRDSSQGNMQQLIEVVKRYERKYVPILLHASREELERRNASRSYTVPLDEFNILYTNVCKKIGSDEVVIDTTKKTPEESIGLLHDRLLGEGP